MKIEERAVILYAGGRFGTFTKSNTTTRDLIHSALLQQMLILQSLHQHQLQHQHQAQAQAQAPN